MMRVPAKTVLFPSLLATALITSLSISVSYAGFEWVPPEEPATPPPAAVQPQAPAVAAPPAAVRTAPLETQDMATPQHPTAPAAQPVMQPRQPQKLLPLEPLPGVDDLAPPSTQPQRVRVQPPPVAPQEPVIKVRDFTPEKNTAEKLLEASQEPVTKVHMNAPEQETEIPAPETPVQMKTTVKMPEDAPESARKKFENSEEVGIKINPNPVIEAPKEPEMVNESSYENVDGFGSDIPLALALSQIVPPSYSYSFAEGINVGQKVSWSGGKPWDQIINEMVTPLNLASVVRGKVVHIYNPDKTSAVSTEAGEKPEPLAEMESAAGTPETDAPALVARSSELANETSDNIQPLAISRRITIKDPGASESKQPTQTLAAMREVEPVVESKPGKLDLEPLETGLLASVESPRQPLAQPIAPTEAEQAPVDLTVPPNRVAMTESSAPAPQTSGLWEARKGDSLKATLSRWSKESGFDLEWQANHDYMLQSDVLVTGDFQRAVKSVFKNAMDPAQMPLLTMMGSKMIIQDDRA